MSMLDLSPPELIISKIQKSAQNPERLTEQNVPPVAITVEFLPESLPADIEESGHGFVFVPGKLFQYLAAFGIVITRSGTLFRAI